MNRSDWPSTMGGVYAQIENVNVYVHPGAVGTTAWVMLKGASGGQWAQVGWIDHQSGARNTFLQVKNSSSDITTRTSDPSKPVGSYPWYTVLYNNVSGKFTFEVDGDAWPWPGYQVNAGFVPTDGSVMGEIQNYNSQMPGATSDVVGFYDAHRWSGGAWTTFSGTAYTWNGTIFAYDGPYYGTQHYIWDAHCVLNG